ncbi:TonB-dependent receptor [Luminiphilus syltensis NOR5-1B]|uniref:TonB-dependent receptor n=1 Tax=Luminiphilus syltensis NOR5-1B TaxID=565045 RepID=B8KSA8_9GAMM|nr:TonB-dependent receptor [Luminiphilus syltensis]EED35652.1 TonB-dependent receptor [Luminiphilus syltensis NOR5-1B]
MKSQNANLQRPASKPRLLTAAICALASSSGSLLLPAAAQAQLEEVVVTARARSESLQDVPSTVTAFTAGQIDDMGIQRAEDFISQTAGVSMINTVETGDSSLSIRGLNGARDAETNFALIIDGILYVNTYAFNREYADLEQIEILKGPQGAQYGRSAAAGAVIMSTKRPTQETEGELKFSFAEDNTYTGLATIAGGLSENVAGRLTVDYRTSDGFYSNSFLNDDVVDNQENYAIQGRLVFDPTDTLSIDTKLRYGKSESAAIAFNAGFAIPSFQAFGTPGSEAFYQDVNDHDFIFSNNVKPDNQQDVWEFSIKADWQFDWASMTTWMAYSDTEDSFIADGTSGAFGFYNGTEACQNTLDALAPSYTPDVPGGVTALPAPTFIFGSAPGAAVLPPYSPTTCDGYQYQERFQEDISFQIQFDSPADQALRWQAGAYFLDIERYQAVSQALDDGTNWPNPSGNTPQEIFSPLTDAMVNDTFDTTVLAVFGSFAYDISDRIELSVAARYDREKREATNNVPSPADGNFSNFIDFCGGQCTLDGETLPASPLNPGFVNFDDFTVASEIGKRSETFDQIQPKVSLTWDVTDDTTVYTSWGVGFKAGGFNNAGSTEIVDFYLVQNGGALVAPPVLFEEETSSAFELGFRSALLDNTLNLNGAVFYTEVDDMQFFEFFVGPFGLLRTASNIDEVTLQGFELSAQWAMTDALRLDVGYSQVDGEIDKNSLRDYTVGNEVPNNPEFTANAALQYTQPIGDWEMFGRFEYSYKGDTYYHTVQDDIVPATLFGGPPANYDVTKVDGFGLANVRLGLRSMNWSITAFAQNVFDEEFIAEVILAPEFGGGFISPGTQRRMGLEVSYNF